MSKPAEFVTLQDLYDYYNEQEVEAIKKEAAWLFDNRFTEDVRDVYSYYLEKAKYEETFRLDQMNAVMRE